MDILKLLSKWVFPIIIIILIVAFIIWASTSEGFFSCPDGTELRNGGCYSCEAGYKLNSDYYNTFCIDSSNDIKPAIMTHVV